LSALPREPNAPLRRLPLVTLYLSERCNSRCISRDATMSYAEVSAPLSLLGAMGAVLRVLLAAAARRVTRRWRQRHYRAHMAEY